MTGRIGAAAAEPRGGRCARRRPRAAARATTVAVLLMTAPAAAQTPAPDETPAAESTVGALSPESLAQTPASDETSSAESAIGALSPESLARIRAALQADRRAEGSARTVFSDPDAGWIVPPRPPVELAPGLGFVEGLGLFDDLTRGREPAPFGGPSHWEMMNHMQPREVTEVAQTDVLGIATASTVAAGLPYVVRRVAGWFSGLRSRGGVSTPPVLASTQEAAVLEDMRADAGVLDATLRQRGRTVTLSLVVPTETGLQDARAAGERFVRLVGRQSAAGPDAFDYVVSVRSPDAVIATGGKPTTDPLVRW